MRTTQEFPLTHKNAPAWRNIDKLQTVYCIHTRLTNNKEVSNK